MVNFIGRFCGRISGLVLAAVLTSACANPFADDADAGAAPVPIAVTPATLPRFIDVTGGMMRELPPPPLPPLTTTAPKPAFVDLRAGSSPAPAPR